ncbi:MAG: hypothetical protein COA73_16360 [Candidatus Hydrogenedentota bacterium]|nr:MAG: hypothetical protein COA73_16360 [Candidatus Hydrogenedentota bacterium]
MRYSDLAEVLSKLLGLYFLIVLVSMTILSMSFPFSEYMFEMMISLLWILLGIFIITYVLIVKSQWVVRKVLRISDAPLNTSATLSPAWYTMGLIFIAALNILRSIQFFVGRIIGELLLTGIDSEEIPGFEPWHNMSNLVSEGLQFLLAILLIAFAGRIGNFLYNLHSQPVPTPNEDPSA